MGLAVIATTADGSGRLVKQPGESKLYSCDFDNLLTGSAVLSGTPTVASTPSGLTVDPSPALDSTTKKVEVRLSSGTDGQEYRVVFKSSDDASNNHEVDCLLTVCN